MSPPGVAQHGRTALSCHPSAAGYADFADFGFFFLDLERAHFVGGFGRIIPLDRSEVLADVSAAGDLVTAEPELIARLNREQAGRVGLLGEHLSGGKEGAWHLTGVDPQGCDLALAAVRLRLDFPAPVTTADAARRVLSEILKPA